MEQMEKIQGTEKEFIKVFQRYIPDKQISKWRKYSKNRQEKALCSYIKTLYKVDEEFIEQIPKLLNMIIDPIV